MIKCMNLNKQYEGGKHAAKDINFEVEDGEIFGFIGPNGAGKTTTLKMLTGLLKPTSGTAEINGYDILKDPINVKRNYAYVPDHPEVFGELKANEYLDFIVKMYDLSPEQAAVRVKKYADLFGMTEEMNNKISSFSHGMRQKLLIITAFVINPKLLIFDEPHVGLDPQAQRTLKDSMKEHCAQGGTVLFSSHVLETVENLCHRVAIISRGEILKVGTLEEIKGDSHLSLEDIFLEMTK